MFGWALLEIRATVQRQERKAHVEAIKRIVAPLIRIGSREIRHRHPMVVAAEKCTILTGFLFHCDIQIKCIVRCCASARAAMHFPTGR
jgi:hypothetical protein